MCLTSRLLPIPYIIHSLARSRRTTGNSIREEQPELETLRKSIWCFSPKSFQKATVLPPSLPRKLLSSVHPLRPCGARRDGAEWRLRGHWHCMHCKLVFISTFVDGYLFFLAAKWKLNHISPHLDNKAACVSPRHRSSFLSFSLARLAVLVA